MSLLKAPGSALRHIASLCMMTAFFFVSAASAADGATEDSSSLESDSEARQGGAQKVGSSPAKASPAPPGTGYASLAPLTWPSHYRRFGVADGIVTGVFGGAAIVTRAIGPRASGPVGGIWFDESIRNAMRANDFSWRLRAADLSDVFLGLSVSYALLGDPLVNAAWLRGSKDVGRQLFWLNIEVLAVTLGTQQVVANAVGRERPYVRTCGTEELGDDTHWCRTADVRRSFFSGHTSVPFAMAAATCTHHMHFALAPDHAWAPCTVGFVVAAASGAMRIVSDYHYATDVFAGALIGSSIGFALPLLHYKTGKDPLATQVGQVEMRLIPTLGGLQIHGVMP